VALQLPNGERLQHQFAPSTSLGEIVVFWEQTNKINLSLPVNIKGTPHYIAINFMNREITFDKLGETTLQHLGLTSGSGLLRVLHRPATEQMPTTLILPTQSQPRPSQTPTPSWA